jgi:hypothetical protein
MLPTLYFLLSVNQSANSKKKILYQGLQKDIPWMVWMMEFEASPSVSCCDTFHYHLNSVTELTEPAHSEIYHYQHLCVKNGLTLNICEHWRTQGGGLGGSTPPKF